MKIKKGFTLIELIVVIAILAVLAMILVPSLTQYIKESEKSRAVSNARTCYITGVYAQGIQPDNWQAAVPDLLEPEFKCTYKIEANGDIKYAEWKEDSGAGAQYYKGGNVIILE